MHPSAVSYRSLAISTLTPRPIRFLRRQRRGQQRPRVCPSTASPPWLSYPPRAKRRWPRAAEELQVRKARGTRTHGQGNQELGGVSTSVAMAWGAGSLNQHAVGLGRADLPDACAGRLNLGTRSQPLAATIRASVVDLLEVFFERSAAADNHRAGQS